MDKPRKGLKWWIRRLALATAALVAALIVAEAVMRATQPRVLPAQFGRGADVDSADVLIQDTGSGRRTVPGGRVRVKNHPTSGLDIELRINAAGFRDDEELTAKQPGELRVLVLGDSITFGDWLPVEQVYAERAERYLAKMYPKRRVTVLNAGVGDAGVREAVGVLTERGLAAEPDIVVYQYYLNDSRPSMGFAGELTAPNWLRRRSVLADTIHRRFKLYRWLEHEDYRRFRWVYALDELPWQTDRQAMQQLIELARFDWGAAWREADWRFIDEHLQRMVTTCRENSLPLLVMTWPSRYQAQAVFVEDQPQQWMAQRSERWGFAHLDLLACLRAMRPEGPAFYDACHVDAVTNDAVGFVLAHALAVGGGEPFRAVEPADAPKSAGACLWASAMMGRGSDPYLTRALALAKQDYATLFDLGRVLVRYDRAADARPFFEAAVAQDPQRIAARMNLAVSLTEAGQFEAAVEQLNHAATLKPDAAGIHNETGIVRMRQQRWTDAAEAFRRALAIDPQYAPARDNLEQIKRRLEMQSD